MPTSPSNRAQLRIDVMNWADASGSQHWDTSAGGEVDRRLGIVHMQEWRRVLNAAAYYQTAQLTLTTDTAGNLPVASLSTGIGDAQQNLYRVLSLFPLNSAVPYQEINVQAIQRMLPFQTTGPSYGIWYRNGSLITIPGNLAMQFTVWVSWTPTRFDQLASDASIVALPDDYGDIFALEGAARLLMKGDAESSAALDLKAQAEELRRDRLQDLSRISINPLTIQMDDSKNDWGSQ